MGSKQNLQLLSALADTLEKSRQNRLEAVAAVSTLRCHLSALASSSDNVNGTDTSQRIQQSPLQHSDCYSEILLSKYRENCSRLQHDLLDTKAKLAASESHVQDLQEEIHQLKALLDSAHQEMHGQAAAPTSALRTNHSTIEIDFDPQPAVDILQNRPQQPSRAVVLQPCLTNAKTQDPTRLQSDGYKVADGKNLNK